jgi:menaquinone-dependent protoporphyrinogen oxidase
MLEQALGARSVLVAYATRYGSTREVAEAVAATLGEHGLEVDLLRAAEVADLGLYDGVVLGGGLYMGRWHADARRFLRRHRVALAARPIAVFALGPMTLADDEVAQSRSQLEHALAKVAEISPVAEAVFGGVVDPERFRFPLNHLPASDARDWDAIRAWATDVAAELGAVEAPVAAR